VHSSASGMQNVDALFFVLGCTQYGLHKKRVGTRYTELVPLHPVGSVRHVVHSGASGARNLDTLFFMPGWTRCYFHKKCTGTYYTKLVFLHLVGSAGHVVHSFSLLRIIHVVWSLNLLLNVFIFITRVIILLLVCLVIIDQLCVFASTMLDIIVEVLPNFSNIF
jgi:hypothetical protein